MNGIIPNENTKMLRCDTIDDLEIKNLIEITPEGHFAVVGTEKGIADYIKKISQIPAKIISGSPIMARPEIKVWYINYFHTHEEYISIMENLRKYIDLEVFYYQSIVDSTDFVVFIGASNVSVIYSDGKAIYSEKENNKLKDELSNLKTDLNAIPKWIKQIFIRKR